MRRGLTLVELMATLGTMLMAITGAFVVMLAGLKSFQRTQADVSVSQPNAQAMRRIADTLRGAMAVTILDSGRTISYQLPALTSSVNATTGEREFASPFVSDGVARSFSVSTAGNLVSQPDGRTLLRNVRSTDPLPGSSQYNLTYAPFQSTTIGSRRAITVTLIALEGVAGTARYARMKSTVLIQNAR
jgi:Tfp pilus assembly protein PilW